MGHCLNCGTESGDKYCPKCGQEVEMMRLEVKTVFRDITHGILHWENSILKTFKELLLRPGKTTRNYISGVRKSYVKPFTYFIFLQTVFVLLFHFSSGKYYAFVNISFTPDSQQIDVLQVQKIINSYINYFNYVMPLFFGFYLFLFFRKQCGINYAESIVASLYWIGTTLVFGIIFMLLTFIGVNIKNIRVVIYLAYLMFAIIQFSGAVNFKTIIKSFFTVVLSFITFILFIGALLTRLFEK